MWVFTNRGFYSVVQNEDDPSELVVRARARGDLENLREFIPGLKILEWEGRDYPCRIIVHRPVWERAMQALTQDIDYGNYKDSVKAKQGAERADLYLRIWSAGCLIGRPARKPQRYVSPLFDDLHYGDRTAAFFEDEVPWDDAPLPWDPPKPSGSKASKRRARRRRAQALRTLDRAVQAAATLPAHRRMKGPSR